MAHSGNIAPVSRPVHNSKIAEIIQNLLVALTVSFVALSLGAAFGVLSGRGAFVGMFSAGLIAFITGALGGTRVQCSGPVAPIAAVMAGLFTAATTDYAANPMALGGVTPDHFLNLTCFICGAIMLLMALFRTGKLITYVPDTVISGFMTGIALIIWIGQTKFLFGLAGTKQIEGSIVENLVIVALTVAMTFVTYPILKRINEHVARIMPGTLVALIVATIFADVFHFDIQHVKIDVTIPGWTGFVDMIKAQIPQNVTVEALKKAALPGFEFALISFLDTLMVAMIVDRLTGEKTRQNKELMAQGIANTAVGFIGGIPGTQASIRSVMMIKEGATMRMAGMMVGVFVILEMLMFQSHIELLPQAVFVGILMKVGWNVCDRVPIWNYITRKADRPSTLDFITIVGTAIVTVYDLSLAVVTFTALHYAVSFIQKRRVTPHAPIPDQLKDVENRV